MPKGRAGFEPTGTNRMGASLGMRSRINARNGTGKWRVPALAAFPLPAAGISRTNPPSMADLDPPSGGHPNGPVYRVAGALTITRAATTQREIDALPDPLTIDLSEIQRMDTVGAWIVYRTVRDRKAKVIGASRDETSLLEQVAEFDKPVRVHPEEKTSLFTVMAELGEYIAEAGSTLVGLLGFFGATLIGFANLIRR